MTDNPQEAAWVAGEINGKVVDNPMYPLLRECIMTNHIRGDGRYLHFSASKGLLAEAVKVLPKELARQAQQLSMQNFEASAQNLWASANGIGLFIWV